MLFCNFEFCFFASVGKMVLWQSVVRKMQQSGNVRILIKEETAEATVALFLFVWYGVHN